MITLPSSFVGDLTTAVGGDIAALAPILLALGGVILAFWVIKRIMGLIPKTK